MGIVDHTCAYSATTITSITQQKQIVCRLVTHVFTPAIFDSKIMIDQIDTKRYCSTFTLLAM